jgi:hypothetical protein
MDLQTFFTQTADYTISLEAPPNKRVERKLSNEALFQLPFISMAILFLSKGRSKPSLSEIAQKLGYAFERSFVAFKGSSQHLGWSSNMRLRTTTAFSFLELSKLVTVDKYNKEVSITDLGKSVIEKVMSQEGNLKDNVTIVCKNFNGIKKEDKFKGLLYETY